MTNPRLGLCFVPWLPPERVLPVAAAADAAGLDELWFWEDCFKESGIAAASAALAATQRIRVGIGLLPVPLRNVAVLAMEVATLDRMFPGRLITGIGHGVQPWMEQVGARVSSPMTLLREYTVALRRLLNGERLDVDGRYVTLRDVGLDWPPLRPPTLMLGGAGPASLRLAGELGDGTLLSAAMSAQDIAAACELARRGLAESGRSGALHDVVATQIVATGPDAQQRVDAEVALWGGRPGPDVGVAGDAEVVAESLLRLARFGVTAVAIQPTQTESDLEGLITFLGTRVRPLLAGQPIAFHSVAHPPSPSDR